MHLGLTAPTTSLVICRSIKNLHLLFDDQTKKKHDNLQSSSAQMFLTNLNNDLHVFHAR